MASLNKVTLIGNLGRDPEVRYMPNGEAVCNFSIATSETWNDRQTGERQERVEWHNITLYRRLAEVAGQYLRKGSSVYLEGRIQSRKYTDKNGVERTAYDIIASEMKMLGSRSESGEAAQARGHEQAPVPAQEGAAPAAPAAPRRNPPVAPASPVDDIDDDIPF